MQKKTKYQKFETRLISRDQIKKAPYNPRVIDEDAKKRLKQKLKEVGLLEPLVWNERTGNLVSGHQRIDILDAMEGSSNYTLEVAVVDLDDKTEKEMNVFLNNPSAMGEWDIDGLAKLKLDFDVDFKDMGFSDFDIDLLFDGDSRFSKLFEDDSEAREAKGTLDDIKAARGKANERLTQENSADFYFVVVCQSQEEKDALLKSMGLPRSEQYVSSGRLSRIKPAQSEE